MSRRTWIVTALVLGSFALLILLAVRPTGDASPPLPSPNGYADLVKAGKMVSGLPDSYLKTSEQDLRAFVSTNAEALRLVRIGLGRECRVPLFDSEVGFTKHSERLSPLKALAWALAAEGRLAELEQRTNDALRAYLDCFQFGHQIARGGVMIDSLVGVACQAIALRALQGLVPALSVRECGDAIRQIEELEARREPANEAARRDRVSMRRAFGWRVRLMEMFDLTDSRKAEARHEARVKQRQRQASATPQRGQL
jgi:hypothetical protein